MSLIENMMEPCIFLNRIRQDDLVGGYADIWTDGARFNAAVIKDNTTEQRIAEKQGITETFTVVTQKGFTLDYHDAFRRVRDGSVFRVTSRIIDGEAPEASTVKIAKVTAERWELPS